jgi:hypothetical protein
MKQLLVTKRERLMGPAARAASHDLIRSIVSEYSARVIGVPGFSTRIAVPAAQARSLQTSLEQRNFIVEDDYALESFGRSRAIRSTGQTRGR